MTPEAITLRDAFETLVELPPGVREARLSALPPEVAQALRAMLAADAGGDGVFAASAVAWAAQLAPEDEGDEDDEALLGQEIGGFRVVSRLGHGGSSVVFRAERAVGGGTQAVALKLLRNGLFSREAQRRFRREQAVLAQFSHPAVARLVDAGTSEAGIPWIAMELIDGEPITAFAESRSLDRAARLSLLAALALAVDAAHRALVVHRDLKPSNVFVTRDGATKVLDFGIARVLGDEGDTATRQIALTPGYAAPEQYRGEPPTTAVDVYALGAIASELLLGRRLGVDAQLPADADASLRLRWRRLDRDLARLLRCALASAPERRYASARHLADDIARFVRREPLAAHPPSWRYRAAKFIARHRVALALGASVFVALLLALGVVLHQRQLAQHQAARADTLRGFLFDTFADAEPGSPREGPVTVVDAVRAALRSSSDGADDGITRLELRLRLAQVLQRQGDLDGARVVIDEVEAAAARLADDEDALLFDAREASVQNAMARGEYAGARAKLDALLERARPVAAPRAWRQWLDPARAVEAEHRYIALLSRSAVLATRVRDRPRARRDGEDAVARARAAGDAELLRAALNDWGIVLLALDEVPRAIAVHEELVALNVAKFGAAHVRVANVQAALSRAYRRAGDHERAVQAARAAVAIDAAIYDGDDRHAAINLNALMLALRARGDIEGALVAGREALRLSRATLGDEHPDVAIAMYGVGELETLHDDPAAAVPLLHEAVALNERRFGKAHWSSNVVRAQLGLARALAANDDAGYRAGRDELEGAIAALQVLPDPDPDHLASAVEKRIRLALARDDGHDAMPWIARLDALAPGAPPTRASWTGRRETLRAAALLAPLRASGTVSADRAEAPASEALPGTASIASAALAALLRAGESIDAAPGVDTALRVEHGLLLARAYALAGEAEASSQAARTAREGLRSMPFVPARLRALEAGTPR